MIKYPRRALIGILLIIHATGLVVAVSHQSWTALIVVVATLSTVVAVIMHELRRTRIALRGLQQRVERADKRLRELGLRNDPAHKMTPKKSHDALAARVTQLETSQTNLRTSYSRIAASVYDVGRLSLGSRQIDMPAEVMLPAVRGLIIRGDVLDAFELLADSKSLHRVDTKTLRTLRNELKRRGYLTRSLEVARTVTARQDDDDDLRSRKLIEGEIAVLSGAFTPTIRPENGKFRPHARRVLHLVGTCLPDKQTGYTLRTHYSALAQERCGLEPHIVAQMGFENRSNDYQRYAIDGIIYHKIPGPARGDEPLNIWARMNVQRVANLVRVVRPAVIHAASDYLNAQAATVVGREFGIPIVYESRGFWEETWLSRQAQTYGWTDLDLLAKDFGLPDVYLWRREIEDRSRREVDHVVTLDEVMADRIEAGGVPRERITVVPNAVDPDRFPVLERNHELVARLGFDEDTIVMGYISSIVEYEGIDTLIDAYAAVLASTRQKVGLLIVGDGPMLDKLKTQARQLELANVVFTGNVPHNEVLDYHGVIDIFVVPRRPVDVCHLVTPLKPYEAFSTGRVVVLSDVRALANIATRSKAAELFEAGSADSLAQVLGELIDDPTRRRALATAGAAWVREDHTWDSNAESYSHLYRRLGAVRPEKDQTTADDVEEVGLELVRRSVPSHKLVAQDQLASRNSDEGRSRVQNGTADGVDFVARPFVCGAIGQWDPAILYRLRCAGPESLREICSGPAATVWATSDIGTWRNGPREGYFWWSLADGSMPSSWQSAAQERLAAGLVVDEDGAVLHSCGLGVQELYFRQVAGALYFSVRIEPLLDLLPEKANADLGAWASIFALGSPIGDATPFKEVRRVTASTAWRARLDGRIERLSFEPSWTQVEEAVRADPAAVAEMVASQMPLGAGRLAVALSGGWDSRLLAALACERAECSPTAWTSATDDGRERDLRLAGSVADVLGMRHRVIVPDEGSWVADREETRVRVQYQTWYHVWFMPLARNLHAENSVVLDGFGGDALLKDSPFVLAAARAEGTIREQRLALLHRLCQGRLAPDGFLAAPMYECVRDSVRTSFMETTSHYDGHPRALTLAQFVTRNTRAIAASPLWLLSPEVDVQFPILGRELLETALAMPKAQAASGEFYRELHGLVCGPTVRGLLSTHDLDPDKTPVARRQTGRNAVEATVRSIVMDEQVRQLLHPKVAGRLEDPDLRVRIARSPLLRVTLQWADLLASWRREYASRIAWPELNQ